MQAILNCLIKELNSGNATLRCLLYGRSPRLALSELLDNSIEALRTSSKGFVD